jgi:hypothetical protein
MSTDPGMDCPARVPAKPLGRQEKKECAEAQGTKKEKRRWKGSLDVLADTSGVA